MSISSFICFRPLPFRLLWISGVIAAVLLAWMAVAIEAGFRYGVARRAVHSDASRAQLNTTQTTIFGILANPVYRGRAAYGRRDTNKKWRTSDEWLSGEVTMSTTSTSGCKTSIGSATSWTPGRRVCKSCQISFRRAHTGPIRAKPRGIKRSST